jgi:hypothetical protein
MPTANMEKLLREIVLTNTMMLDKASPDLPGESILDMTTDIQASATTEVP